MYPVYYNTGRAISLGCDSANNSYMDFHCVDAATTPQADVRIQASGGTAGSNFTSALSFYGSNFYFNGGTLTCGTLTCTTLNYSSLSVGPLSAPTITGSTTVNQTSSTLPTTGAQIGFLLKAKLSGLQATSGWLITTSAAAITNIAYTIPAIGVWMCVFEASPSGFTTTQKIVFGLSTSSTSMDSGWPYQTNGGGNSLIHTTRVFTVTDLTTTIYPLVYVDTANGAQYIGSPTVQCVRIA
jgi:hypothetical protein